MVLWLILLHPYGTGSPEGGTTVGIDGIPLSTLTPAGLLALLVLLIALGKLVPRKTLEDIIHDRDEWRAAHRISESARAELASQVTELLEHARTTDAFIRAIPRAAEQSRGARDADDG